MLSETIITTIVVVLNLHGASTLNSVLNLNETYPYLINKTSGQVIEPRDYMDFDNIYSPNETYRLKQTAQGRNYHLIKAFDFATYFKADYWRYSSEEDLKLSAQPVANPQLCTKHLNWLETQLNRTKTLFKSGQEHVNLMTLVDSFGRPESITYYGHGHWIGSYYECLKSSINIEQFDQEECKNEGNCENIPNPIIVNNTKFLKTRYCVGKARDIDWPNENEDDYKPVITYKIGLCLPESCETLSFKEHQYQIERLMRFNIPEYMKDRLYLNEIYCLPDPRSPIRSFSLSSKIFITLNIIWFVIISISSITFAFYKRHQKDLRDIITNDLTSTIIQYNNNFHQQAIVISEQSPTTTTTTNNNNDTLYIKSYSLTCKQSIADTGTNDLTSNCTLLNGAQKVLVKSTNPTRTTNKIHHSVNHVNHHQSIYSLSHSSSTSLSSWLQKSPTIIKILQCISINENLREFRQTPLLMRTRDSSQKLRINLNSMDCIKCLCCILVILGHIMFIYMQHLSNIFRPIEISEKLYPRFFIAFFNFVDTFFIISGMLTAYFILKRFNKRTFSNPIIWLFISLLRLLRLTPVYILIFWFTKTTTVYLFDGPLWDYGTDKESTRGLCMNDHWWKSILYLGNVGSMQPLCILPAWSIIVDSQYSIILPPLIYLLMNKRKLTYILLIAATIISTAKMSIQLATQTSVKPADMSMVRLHVYPIISRFCAEFYNSVWNRIGPVAIGVIGGHMLYLYDVGKLRRWPWFMRDMSFKFILFLHLFIICMPTMSKFADNSKSPSETDLSIFIMSNAAIKPIWSIINTILLLRLVTDLRRHSFCAKLTSHNIWHIMGKLCFASYLIHFELILILLKSREDSQFYPDEPNLAREFSVVFLISTLLAFLVHIVYEAPINKLINLIATKPIYIENEKENHYHKHNIIGANEEENNLDRTVISNNGQCLKPFNSNNHISEDSHDQNQSLTVNCSTDDCSINANNNIQTHHQDHNIINNNNHKNLATSQKMSENLNGREELNNFVHNKSTIH